MARQKRRSQLDAIDEINMTPLIDLTFLLLIIFMITTPLLETGFNVNPPEMTAEELPQENTCVVNLDKLGQILYKKNITSEQELSQNLQDLYMSNPEILVLLRADGLRKYQEVINVLKIIKKSGVKNISLVTQAD